MRSFNQAARAHLGRLGRPELFQVVVRAHRGLHDVHDQIAGVDEDPFRALLALDADDMGAALLELVANVLRERIARLAATVEQRNSGGSAVLVDRGRRSLVVILVARIDGVGQEAGGRCLELL